MGDPTLGGAEPQVRGNCNPSAKLPDLEDSSQWKDSQQQERHHGRPPPCWHLATTRRTQRSQNPLSMTWGCHPICLFETIEPGDFMVRSCELLCMMDQRGMKILHGLWALNGRLARGMPNRSLRVIPIFIGIRRWKVTS